MQPIDVITRLASVSTRAAKEQIIVDAYHKNCFEFFEAVQLAADPFMAFGLTKVAEILEDDGAAGSLTFDDFRALCQQLHNREFDTVEATRQAIHAAAERCHTATWNRLYRRVLLKSLDVVDPSTFSRALKRLPESDRYHVPTFSCQQATMTGRARKGTYLVDVKLTGTRMLAILESSVFLHAADGTVLTMPRLEKVLQPLASRSPFPFVLDGVIVDETYLVFDLIPLADFRLGQSPKTQQERRAMLELLHRAGAFIDPTSVRVLPQISVTFGTLEGDDAFTEFCDQTRMQQHRAVMLKKPDAPYLSKRWSAWVEKNIEQEPMNALI